MLTICLFAQNGTRNNIQNASQERPTFVSVAQALEVGYTFMHSSGHERGNASVNKQAMHLIYTGSEMDRDTRVVTDCYYVFSLQPVGFVIVAADERVKPILGYSYSNDFVIEDMPDNILYWMDSYEKQIKAVIDNDFQSNSEIRTTWSRLKSGQAMPIRSSTSVNPLLQTTWDQSCYYNQLCPVDSDGPCNHVYAGCVATAMAQVMRYWGWPAQGFSSHSYTSNYGTLSVNFSTATYNYDNMPNALTYSTSASQKEEVAKFIYHCGVAVDMDYAPDGSGAYSSDVPAALYNYFAYTDNGTYRYKSSYSESGWANLIKQELNNMRPVYYSGHGTGGHAFVCDGYDENGLFHFNWGWSGSNNGYFELSTLNPSTYDFSESQAAITGVTAGTFIRSSESELSFSARVGEQSTPQSITVCAHGLSGSISVSVGGGFKVSKNGTNYYTSLTLPAAGGTLYVKYVPTQSGDVTDSITMTSGSCSMSVILNGTEKVVVGTGTTTNNTLPSYSYYKYALTQQIYTPAEIGTSGVISSIAFYNGGTEKTRNYDMYLVLTDKDTFASGTDWIAVSEDDKVFSGVVTMSAGTWTTFEIDSFAYDGVNNLAIIMDDNTGSYSSGMACRVFHAENKALRIYSDGTNYDPANPGSYDGTVVDQKNQLKIDIDPSVVICEKPMNLTFSNLTPTSVSVSWSNGSGSFGYEYKKTSDAEWTVASTGNSGYNCSLTGLAPNTAYQFRVHSICEESSTSRWLNGSFNTPAGIPLVEPFDNSAKPEGWALYTGLLSNVMGGSATLASATSGWTFGTGNGVFDSHARTNIYGSNWNKWLVTPTLMMEDNVQLSFDLALTKYSGNLQQPVDTLQQDDKFVILITTDNGATWEILRQWDNTGSGYVYNHIACSAEGEPVTIDLSAYAGSNIAIAFYGESTVSGNGNNNLHIDNVSIDYIPACPKPTMLTVSDVTSHTAQLNWASNASEWQICLNGDETNLINVTTNSYTLTDLTPETVYTAKVRANCGTELQSPWSNEVSFLPSYWIIIGSGTSTNSYLPSNVNIKFSLTQQIYTVAELGEAGNIVSIGFRKNSSEECERNLEIYMVSTDKSAFTEAKDWVAVTTSNKVFSGTVSFADNDWTTITLDRAFSYDGTSNIAIMVDDNTGRAVTSTPFLSFPAGSQALRVCGRTTNYRATSAGSYSGTIEATKNQIRIMKVDYAPLCDAPAGLAVSEIDHQGAMLTWNGEADSWTVSYRPANTEVGTEVTVEEPSYTLTGLEAETSYKVKVAANCGDETVWSEEKGFTTQAAPCTAIVLGDDGAYRENFDNYTTTTTTETGVQPKCWEVYPLSDVSLTASTMPQVYRGFATSGSYSLRMKNRCVYAMPELDENIAIDQLTMTFNLRQPNSIYRLQVGVVNANGAFTLVKTINNAGTGIESVTVDFAEYTGDGHRIAFRNTLGKGSTLSYSYNYIDDIVITSTTATACGIDVLPYPEQFEGYTNTTATETGVQPDCWEVITEDVALSESTKPQLYRGYSTSGDYTLRLKNRCVYAMPEFTTDVSVSDLTMTFNLRQPNSNYRLQVGVLETDGSFTALKTLKSGTSMQSKTVNFSGYTGTGNRIAFRNTLIPGTGMSTDYLDYSINYIDDINLFRTTGKSMEVTAADAGMMGAGRDMLDVMVYPNPTKEFVNVQCTMYNVQCSGIEVVDVYGKVVRTDVGANNDSATQINVSGLAAGMYFVRVTTDKGVVTKPFVKK